MSQLESDITTATSGAVLGYLYGTAPETFLLGVHARYSGKAVESHAGRRLDAEGVQAQIQCSWNMTVAWIRTAMASAKGKPILAVWLIASDQPDDFFAKTKKFIAAKSTSLLEGRVYVAHATVGKCTKDVHTFSTH
jgi:hypothetical protein